MFLPYQHLLLVRIGGAGSVFSRQSYHSGAPPGRYGVGGRCLVWKVETGRDGYD